MVIQLKQEHKFSTPGVIILRASWKYSLITRHTSRGITERMAANLTVMQSE